ncbi:MAG: ShlB/FhaC/HecB family hemolysin secretion/activation protein [Proteobacteria bacterium]|nr:ShlB/FhaC/HecB family hemolysin secretion/activation protein [Pseudomonadota bacterium]HQR03491.1 ShlB/FhaC/HecB family hemolysin secretion/activation protein [Rhodocyclaceae bacterium]
MVCMLAPVLATAADLPPTPGSVSQSLPSLATPLVTPAQILIPDQPGPVLHDRNGHRFQIHAFRFAGNTVFPAARLKEVVDRFRDLELNLYDLNVAADAVTEFYHDRGYTLARAVVPPQKVEDGVVTLAVVEGRIGRVLFSGNSSYSEDFLRRHTPSLVPGVLATTEMLERSLLLLNDLPGLKVRSTLSPGSEFGAADVLVKAEEQRFGASISIDNAGRKETGRTRVDLGGNLNNPLGIGDQIDLHFLVTDRRLMQFGRIGYSLPLSDDGLRFTVAHSEVHYDVAGIFAALGLDGRVRSNEFGLQYAARRTRGENLSYTLSYKSSRQIQRAFGVETSSVYLPLVTAGVLYNLVGEDASVTNASATLATNFRSHNHSFAQNAELARIEVDANHLQPVDRFWDIYLRGNLVLSKEQLPDSEKFSLGGPGSVRAYRASELRGDAGAQGTLEIRRSLMLAAMPASISFFGDVGRVIYKAPGLRDGWESLAGVGVGLTLYPARQTIVKVEVATPAGGNYHAADGNRGRVWASVSFSY